MSVRVYVWTYAVCEVRCGAGRTAAAAACVLEGCGFKFESQRGAMQPQPQSRPASPPQATHCLPGPQLLDLLQMEPYLAHRTCGRWSRSSSTRCSPLCGPTRSPPHNRSRCSRRRHPPARHLRGTARGGGGRRAGAGEEGVGRGGGGGCWQGRGALAEVRGDGVMTGLGGRMMRGAGTIKGDSGAPLRLQGREIQGLP